MEFRTFKLPNDEIFNSLQAMNLVGEKEPDGELGLKCARFAKVLRSVAVEVQEEREKLSIKFARKYPDDYEDETKRGKPVRKAIPDPENQGAMIQVYDCLDEFQLRQELRKLGKDTSEIRVPQLTAKDLRVLKLKPNVIEPLLWNIDADFAEEGAADV
jgi:hypothetical protein